MERPASFADLDAWSVYGDWLEQSGDPRGALIGMDLALALPERAALDAFQALHREMLGERQQVASAYALGQVRELALAPGQMIKLANGAREAPLDGMLAFARDLLASENCRFLDTITLAQPYEEHAAHWRRLVAALPPSCRRVVLWVRTLPTAVATELAERLPSTVREVAIVRDRLGYRMPVDPRALVADRFEVLELLAVDVSREIRDAFARTSSLRLRLHQHEGSLPARVDLGEAALFQRERRQALALPQWSLLELVRRNGPMPIRTQLARVLPESYDVSPTSGVTIGGRDLVRRGAAWTLRGPAEHGRTYVDSVLVARDAIVPLDHGSRIRFSDDGDDWIFLAHGATAEIRAAA